MMKLGVQITKRRGVVLPLAAVTVAVVLIFTAFVTDIGIILIQKTSLQAAVDSAALAGVMDLGLDESTVEAAVDQYLINNGFDPNTAEITKTLEYLYWDEGAGTFTTEIFANANALRVSTVTTAVPSFFGSMMGYSSYSTSAESIATLTLGPPRDVVLVLDCSGSMEDEMANGQTRIDNTKTAAQALIDSLNDQDRVSLAIYSWPDLSRDFNGNGANDECELTGKIETWLDFDPLTTSSVISTLTYAHYTGGTNIGGGFRAGLDVFLNDPSPRSNADPDLVKVLIMLTDGRVNRLEPFPVPNDGPTGTLPFGPYFHPDDDGETEEFDPLYEQAMQEWANTIKARGIKVYSIKLHGSSGGSFAMTASTPDQYDDQYYFHIAEGSEDVSTLLDVYETIGLGKGVPKLVQ